MFRLKQCFLYGINGTCALELDLVILVDFRNQVNITDAN
jgi:hypothetical protein